MAVLRAMDGKFYDVPDDSGMQRNGSQMQPAVWPFEDRSAILCT